MSKPVICDECEHYSYEYLAINPVEDWCSCGTEKVSAVAVAHEFPLAETKILLVSVTTPKCARGAMVR